jgi:hypothetical protein
MGCRYQNSVPLGRFFKDEKKAIVVILDAGEAPRVIISLHFKKASDFHRLAR